MACGEPPKKYHRQHRRLSRRKKMLNDASRDRAAKLKCKKQRVFAFGPFGNLLGRWRAGNLQKSTTDNTEGSLAGKRCSMTLHGIEPRTLSASNLRSPIELKRLAAAARSIQYILLHRDRQTSGERTRLQKCSERSSLTWSFECSIFHFESCSPGRDTPLMMGPAGSAKARPA